MAGAPASIGAPAALPRRLIAWVADALVLVALVAVATFAGMRLGLATGRPTALTAITLGVVVILVVDVVMSILRAGRGSPGMRATGIVLRRVDGGPTSFASAWARTILCRVFALTVVGAISPLLDGSRLRRGWHDRATGQVVLMGGQAR